MGATRILATFVVDTAFDDIPPQAVRIAKNHILDSLGVAFAASVHPVGRIAQSYARAQGGTPECHVIGAGFQTAAPIAAFANAMQAHGLDFDDTWLPEGHPTAPILHATLPLAEREGLPGRDALAAYILGLEVACKLSGATTGEGHPRGFHGSALYGCLGATAAAARLLRLDTQRTVMALGTAASAAGGLGVQHGTMTKPFHMANTAWNGVTCALLAQEGFTSVDGIIESPHGFADVFLGEGGMDFHQITTNLGNPYHIISPGIALKKYACCYIHHRTLDAVLGLVRRHHLRYDDIAQVEVFVPRHQYNSHYNPTPETGLRGKFSINFVVAAAIYYGNVPRDAFLDDVVTSPELRGAIQKVKITIDERIPHQYPQAYNPVRLRLADGRELFNRVDVPYGHWGNPLSREDLLAKFRDNARLVLPGPQVERAIDLVDHLDELPTIRDLMALLAAQRDPVPA